MGTLSLVFKCVHDTAPVYKVVGLPRTHRRTPRLYRVRTHAHTYVHTRVYVGPIFCQGPGPRLTFARYTAAQIGFEVYRAEILRGSAYPGDEAAQTSREPARERGSVSGNDRVETKLRRRQSCRLF